MVKEEERATTSTARGTSALLTAADQRALVLAPYPSRADKNQSS